jgi:hypothetical protein
MKWAGNVTAYRVLVRKLDGKIHLGNLGVDGRIILNEYLRTRMRSWAGLM